MPCDRDTTVFMEQDFSAANPRILEKALQSLGWRIRSQAGSQEVLSFWDSQNYLHYIREGKLRTVGSDEVIEVSAEVVKQLRRAYAAETVKSAAKQFGWQAKQITQGKFALQRRR